jgi:uncharacterized protein YerC
MARKIVSLQPRQTKPPVATSPQGITLADVTVTHTVGSHVTKVAGGDLAKLIDATRHLHHRDEASDFLDATCFAIELNGMAEVLIDLMDDDEPCVVVAPAAGGSGAPMRDRRQRQNLEGWTRQKTTPAPAPPVPKPARPPRRPPARPPAPPKPR